MWAGVAGGLAEFFDLDPSLVRLLWVAATVVSGGLAVAVYILAWIVLPRDDRPDSAAAHDAWHNWSEEFHKETDRLAEEARRVARGRAPGDPAASTPGAAASNPSTPSTPAQPTPAGEPEPWWQSERYVERHHGHHYPARSAGVVLVVLGVLLLAANAGVFTWIQWRTMWPLIFIGLGVILLGRQSGWWGR
jgi:phage shock protein PspC (stress-responsive transcriptional regulator)